MCLPIEFIVIHFRLPPYINSYFRGVVRKRIKVGRRGESSSSETSCNNRSEEDSWAGISARQMEPYYESRKFIFDLARLNFFASFKCQTPFNPTNQEIFLDEMNAFDRDRI